MEIGGVRLRSCQSKVSTTKGLLDLANESITKAEVGQTKAERDIVKLSKALESNSAKLSEVEGDLEVVEGDLQACTADLNILREKVQEVQDASGDVQENLAESKAELDEKSANINAFRKLEVSCLLLSAWLPLLMIVLCFCRGEKHDAGSDAFGQVDINQGIEDNERRQKDSNDKLHHLQRRNAELELAYVGWV